MKIIVPMAGLGTRFLADADRNSEYKKPKPLIQILGRPMIHWAMRSLKDFNISPEKIAFISLQQQQKQYQIVDELKAIFSPKINVILISEVTRGALETTLCAKDFLKGEEDVIISDTDHFFDGASLKKAVDTKDSDTKGIIPVFKPPDDEVKWSYTLYDKKTRVASAVGEKDADLVAKGAFANIGAYYFSSGNEFIEDAEEMIMSGDMYGAPEKREFYVAPLYQRMVLKGKKVQIAVTKFMWGLGTPKDVEEFEQSYVG